MRSTKSRRLAVVAALAIAAAIGTTTAASATTEPTDTTTAEAPVDDDGASRAQRGRRGHSDVGLGVVSSGG